MMFDLRNEAFKLEIEETVFTLLLMMSFLVRAKRSDLIPLGEELGINILSNAKVTNLAKLKNQNILMKNLLNVS